MKVSTRYVKIVEWSDKDQCYVGSCPGLFYSGSHGNDEQEVFSADIALRWSARMSVTYFYRHITSYEVKENIWAI